MTTGETTEIGAGAAADPRTFELGRDRWLTDARVYNLLWLGRWIERAYDLSRDLLWTVEHDADGQLGRDVDLLLQIAAEVRGIAVPEDSTPLEALLTGDAKASVRACLEAARYNATFVAPVELIQQVAAAIEVFTSAEQPATTGEAVKLIRALLARLDELHNTVEHAWFHSEPLSEEEVYRRFVQQQQQ